MSLEVAGISLKVDSTDAVTAKANLDAMAKAGTSSAAAFTQVEAGARTAGAALSSAASAAGASARGIASTAGGARTAAEGLRATGQQARLTGNQAAQLSAQLQDLFVQIQAGGSPLTALIQQGSQLSAVFGGVAPALRAVAGVVFSTATAYAALAGAGIGLGAAFLVGQQQSADLARALILSGNVAGITEGQFNSLAQAIADSTQTTIGSTRDTLQDLAASGRVSGEVLQSAATAVQLLAKVTGQASTEIAKEFAKAADAPTRFAEETNRSYNFLTASQLAYIRSLEDQGRGQEALELTFQQLIPRLQQAAGATTGLGRAFQEAKSEVSAFFDALASGLGRTDTAEDQLRRVQASIAELQRAGQKGYIFGPSMSDLQQQEAGLQRTIAGQREVAAIRARDGQREQAAVRFDKLREQSLTKQQQLAKALADANSLADRAGVSQADRQGVLASIRQRFAASGSGGGGQARAAFAADLAGIRAAEAEKLAIYRNTEGVIDALRQAGVLRDADYYDAKRAYVKLDQQAQEEAISAEITRLQAFRGTAAENLAAQREIAQARSQLAQVQAAGAARSVILDIQQRAAVDALAKSFREMEFAAVEAYQATARRIDFATGSQGMGDRARDQAADEFNIRERYTRQIQQLEAQNRAGAFAADQAQFARRRQLLLDNQEFELAQTAEAYRRLDELRAKWETGFGAGIANVLDGAADTARRTQQLTEDVFRGLGDALTDVFTTGKADWKSLERTILSGINRIIIEQQAIKPIAQALQGGAGGGEGLLSSLFSSAIGFITGGGTGDYNTLAALSGKRAAGGPVRRGGLYEVNELASHGPGEILTSGGRQYLMAREDGYVRPAAAGAGGVQQVNNFHFSGQVDRRTQQQVATAAGRGAQQAMARNG